MCIKKSTTKPSVSTTVYEAWKTQWTEQCTDSDSSFYQFFTNRFDSACKDADRNRNYNFFLKWIIVGIIALSLIPQLLLLNSFSLENITSKDFTNITKKVTVTEVLIFVILFTIVFALKKALDVKRFQETWARNRYIQHMYTREMLSFLEDISPYAGLNTPTEKCKLFKERILAIDSENSAKFVKNLEEHEIGMLDGIESIVQKF